MGIEVLSCRGKSSRMSEPRKLSRSGSRRERVIFAVAVSRQDRERVIDQAGAGQATTKAERSCDGKLPNADLNRIRGGKETA